MRTQPGYDELASVYDEKFPHGYVSNKERHAVALFAEDVRASGLPGPVADVGCGTGHIAADLASRGLEVVGVDPSSAMLAFARERYPDLRWIAGDAGLAALPQEFPALAGIVARFSLIHVEPALVPGVLSAWSERLLQGALVMVAFQCVDEPGDPVREFDHRVARAWRWHPDAMAQTMAEAGMAEVWRMSVTANETNRFPECHLVGRFAGPPSAWRPS